MALATGLSDEAMHRVVNKVVAMVCDDGNLEACRLLLSYCVGPPMPRSIDPDETDINELQKLRVEAQRDALDNNRLSVPAALALEKAYQLAASAGTLGEELLDRDSSVGPPLLAALKDAGLADLARAAKGYCARMQALEKGSEAEQRTNG
jgi:hypothetical protein